MSPIDICIECCFEVNSTEDILHNVKETYLIVESSLGGLLVSLSHLPDQSLSALDCVGPNHALYPLKRSALRGKLTDNNRLYSF